MPKIKCHDYECGYNRDGKCKARMVEFDSDLCRTFVQYDRYGTPMSKEQIKKRRDENALRVANKIRDDILRRTMEALNAQRKPHNNGGAEC